MNLNVEMFQIRRTKKCLKPVSYYKDFGVDSNNFSYNSDSCFIVVLDIVQSNDILPTPGWPSVLIASTFCWIINPNTLVPCSQTSRKLIAIPGGYSTPIRMLSHRYRCTEWSLYRRKRYLYFHSCIFLEYTYIDAYIYIYIYTYISIAHTHKYIIEWSLEV